MAGVFIFSRKERYRVELKTIIGIGLVLFVVAGLIFLRLRKK